MAFSWSSKSKGSSINLIDLTYIKLNANKIIDDLQCPAFYSHRTGDHQYRSDNSGYDGDYTYDGNRWDKSGNHEYHGVFG